VARSGAYYATAAGKQKKAQLNAKRGQARRSGESAPVPERDDVEFDAGIVEHVRVVTSLIEGVEIRSDEVLAMLRRTVRQHRIVRETRLAYVVRWLAEHPP
jgi:hypothetical protein